MKLNLQLQPGTYVVAVSGGVDSIALLNMLVEQSNSLAVEQSSSRIFAETDRLFNQKTNRPVRLIVAHYEHGMRSDSDQDRQLVQATAEEYGLPFVYQRGRLGADASEDTARKARYEFLHKVRKASGADAVITAHHQDDLLETALMNLMRGTGRLGLASLRDREHLRRPLLEFPKRQLARYAKNNNLQWREDSTNQDLQHIRNLIRHKILPRASITQKQELLQQIRKTCHLNKNIDDLLSELLTTGNTINRSIFIMLPHAVAREFMVWWLRSKNVGEIDAKMIERLVVAAKTFAPGKKADVKNGWKLEVGKKALALSRKER